jgi:Tol biopolymer transport system component
MPPRRTRFRDPHSAVAGALVGATLVAIIAGSGILDRIPPADVAVVSERSIARDRELRSELAPRSIPLLTRSLVGNDVFSPSFDPRGEAIYFHAGRNGSPLMRAAMTEKGTVAGVTKLLDDGAANYHVTMSPNGGMIAFDSDRDGMRGVYVADADGRNARRISGEGYASVPSWSPDGQRIAFVKAEADRDRVWNVWLASPDGRTLDRVTSHPVGQPWGASWFPDGQRLAYSREEQLVLLDLGTGRSTIVTSPRSGHLVRTPAVSPDGARVVFQVHRDGAWMLEVPRMMVRRILPDPSAEEFVWAPNGRTIAYHARSQEGWAVWTIGI